MFNVESIKCSICNTICNEHSYLCSPCSETDSTKSIMVNMSFDYLDSISFTKFRTKCQNCFKNHKNIIRHTGSRPSEHKFLTLTLGPLKEPKLHVYSPNKQIKCADCRGRIRGEFVRCVDCTTEYNLVGPRLSIDRVLTGLMYLVRWLCRWGWSSEARLPRL